MTPTADHPPAPVTRSVTCAHPGGLHRMAYHEWAPAPDRINGRTAVCVHGLTRNGRDFDTLARRLAASGYRVVCPDLAGRGRSARLSDPRQYQVGQYLTDCVTLIARLDTDRVDWIGTSLGGLVSLVLASLPGHPIERMVINDIGPEIDPAGLERIRGYVGDTRVHADFDAAEASLRRTMASFGRHDDAAFRCLSEHYFIDAAGGGLTAHYDPAIAKGIHADQGDPPTLWPAWEAIDVPVLVLRGAASDILSSQTLQRMRNSGPHCQAVEFDEVGHAPTLINEDQVRAVLEWLLGD